MPNEVLDIPHSSTSQSAVQLGDLQKMPSKKQHEMAHPPIDLIDGEQLVQRLKELGIGVKIKMVEFVEVDANWLTKI